MLAHFVPISEIAMSLCLEVTDVLLGFLGANVAPEMKCGQPDVGT